MPGIHDSHRERLRERLRKEGPKNFEDHELLEYLLYAYIPYKDTNPVAHELIDRFGDPYRISAASPERLEAIPNMTEKAALFLATLGEYSLRIENAKRGAAPKILGCAADVAEFGRRIIADLQYESALFILLGARDNVVDTRIFDGGIQNVKIRHRELMEAIFFRQAVRVALVHNHPSGDTAPSKDDYNYTHALVRALAASDVVLLDHVIINPAGDYYSFHASGELLRLYDSEMEYLNPRLIAEVSSKSYNK